MKNRTQIMTGAAAGLLVFVSALPSLHAQAPAPAPPTSPNLAMIRRNTTISPIDNQNIAKWVDAQLDTLFNSANFNVDAAKLRAVLLENHDANDATPEFKRVLAVALADSLGRHYPGNTTQPLPVVFSLAILQLFDDPSAVPVSQKAMTDSSNPPAPGVRVAGIANLLHLRKSINAQTWTAIVADAQKSAATSNDPLVIQGIYQLLATDSPDPRAQEEGIAAIRAIMEARLTQYEKKGESPPIAERDAAIWLGTRTAALTNAPRVNDLTGLLGRLLSDAAFAYVNQKWSPSGKERLERVIVASEQALKSIATAKAQGKAPPDVTKAVLNTGPDQAKRITDEVNKWIGTAAAPGFLNQPPFNLPTGLNIQRTVPTTSTSSAPE